jgi:hypothetical protein
MDLDLPPSDAGNSSPAAKRSARTGRGGGALPPVSGGADGAGRSIGRVVGRLLRRLDKVALTLMQSVVSAVNSIPMLRDVRPSIGLVGPVISLSFEVKAELGSVGEIFEALRRRL